MDALSVPPAEDDDTPSGKNKRTQDEGLLLLLSDPRIQAPSRKTKWRILELLNVSGAFKPETFDAVMTTDPVPKLTEDNVENYIPSLTLVEMKATRAAIADASLSKFFFGATENEFQMAKALKARYVFAFAVLSEQNVYGKPFFVLLTLEELQARVKTSRIQYQINLRSNMPTDDPALPLTGVGPLGIGE